LVLNRKTTALPAGINPKMGREHEARLATAGAAAAWL